MTGLLSVYWVLAGAIWYTLNGILHDVFVIRNHKGTYDRELLRLLMDGHVLILSGLLLFACFMGIRNNQQYAALSAMIVAIGMLVYCLMIFPFLKSFGTLFVSMMVLAVAARCYWNMLQ